jgi:hypothetical protein
LLSLVASVSVVLQLELDLPLLVASALFPPSTVGTFRVCFVMREREEACALRKEVGKAAELPDAAAAAVAVCCNSSSASSDTRARNTPPPVLVLVRSMDCIIDRLSSTGSRCS